MACKIGICALQADWDARVKDVGGRVATRRIFGDLGSYSGALGLAKRALADGQWPILSFKLPGNDWAGTASGTYDRQLREVGAALAQFNARVFVTLHHEPTGDGTPENYAAMLTHGLPILKGGHDLVRVGPIVNGYWWSSTGAGFSDATIAQWLPQSVLDVSDIVAGDTYHNGLVSKPGEDAATKMLNMGKWATRHNVPRLGIGEYQGLTAAAITRAGDVLLADDRFRFAQIYDSNFNNRAGVQWQLTGDRLAAFKATLTKSFSL